MHRTGLGIQVVLQSGGQVGHLGWRGTKGKCSPRGLYSFQTPGLSHLHVGNCSTTTNVIITAGPPGVRGSTGQLTLHCNAPPTPRFVHPAAFQSPPESNPTQVFLGIGQNQAAAAPILPWQCQRVIAGNPTRTTPSNGRHTHRWGTTARVTHPR